VLAVRDIKELLADVWRESNIVNICCKINERIGHSLEKERQGDKETGRQGQGQAGTYLALVVRKKRARGFELFPLVLAIGFANVNLDSICSGRLD
jgi:hypothetical protein